MNKIIRIAVDGPSGAGKSTIARKVAKKLGIEYVDTGAMYRAVAYKMTSEGIGPEEGERIEAVLKDTVIDFDQGVITVDGTEVESKIRTPEISEAASIYSALPPVRASLVQAQREIGHRKSVIMDGRDIGTNVFPDAQYKFYLTATAEERADRRYKELVERGQEVVYEEILEDIRQRDHNDMTRVLNPLRKAEDAIEVDSTHMSIDEVVDFIYDRVV
ncbi:(d)CMP kinase [Eubacterium sp. AB3007]|uniref:(d)CMP kinase n=1 Tax=Eubacterium sp. AB3007 TaxID=1392487 RepID=UPI000551D9D1|nr:(d)CMP kinase [Eubacterium sp. AB3007]MBQ1471932.1 (d)CMP kinase [Eubacterium sp.]